MSTPARHLSILEAEPEAELLAHYAREVEDRRRRHPAMFDAKQPVPLKSQNGKFFLDPKQRFAETITSRIAAGTYQLRLPAMSVSAMIGTTCIGDCLSPFIRHGDSFWYDPTIEPKVGDAVVVLMAAPTLQATVNFHRKHAELLAVYGETCSPFAVKVLTSTNADYHCISADGGALPLWQGLSEPNRICGVVRRVVRDGRRLYEGKDLQNDSLLPGAGVAGVAV